jgi:hypothetical protein
MDEEPDHREVRVVHVQPADTRASPQKLPTLEAATENSVGGGAERQTGRWKDRFKIRDLFAGDLCLADSGLPAQHRSGTYGGDRRDDGGGPERGLKEEAEGSGIRKRSRGRGQLSFVFPLSFESEIGLAADGAGGATAGHLQTDLTVISP